MYIGVFQACVYNVPSRLHTWFANTLKSLINEQGGFVVFLVLSKYSFIGDLRVAFATYNPAKKIMAELLSHAKIFFDKKSKVLNHGLQTPTKPFYIKIPNFWAWADNLGG